MAFWVKEGKAGAEHVTRAGGMRNAYKTIQERLMKHCTGVRILNSSFKIVIVYRFLKCE